MRLLGALAFAVVCLLALAGRPGPLRAADFSITLDKAGNVGDWARGLTFHIVGSKAHPRVEIVQP